VKGAGNTINYYAAPIAQGDDARFLATPMDLVFYLSIVNNVFSVMAGRCRLTQSIPHSKGLEFGA
jgi:hypothetical protein